MMFMCNFNSAFKSASSDVLVVTTERYHFCVLQYNPATSVVETIAHGNLRDKCCRPAESGQLMCIDRQDRLVILHVFQGLLKIIPVDTKKAELKFKDAYNVRIEELSIKSLALQHETGKPLLAVLYEYVGAKRSVKSYALEQDKKLSAGPFSFDVDDSSYLLISVPKPRGGLLIVADRCIQYYNDQHKTKLAVSLRAVSKIVAHTCIDEDGFRFLLADQKGHLMVLVLKADDQGKVTDLKLEGLGHVSSPTCLEYLDAGQVFVGSKLGPSQIVQMSSKRFEDGSFIKVMESYENISPILDFKLVDLDNSGQESLVACSGGFQNGGLSLIRRGINVNVDASFSLDCEEGKQYVFDFWPLDLAGSGKADHIVVGTPFSSNLIKIDAGRSEIESVNNTFILASSPSVYISQYGPLVYQVLSTAIHYQSCLSGGERKIWMPQNGVFILNAVTLENVMVVGLSSGHLISFRVSEKELVQDKIVQLPTAPSELSLVKVGREIHAFVGSWESALLSVNLSVRELIVTKLANLEMVPRSIASMASGADTIIFVGFPNGTVLYSKLVQSNNAMALSEPRQVILGKEPVSLSAVGNGSLFARCDSPSVIALVDGRPHFLSVPLIQIYLWKAVKLPNKQDAFISVDKNGNFTIGSLDLNMHRTRLHMIKIPIGETARRIVHLKKSSVFAVITIKSDPESFDNFSSSDVSTLYLFDDKSFEVIDKYVLPRNEIAQSLLNISVPGDIETILVGTAVSDPNDAGQSFDSLNGRILSFRLVNSHEGGKSEPKLSLVNGLNVNGAVYSMAWLKDRLVASVNGQTTLYSWEESGDDMQWKELSQHYGQIIGIHMDVQEDMIAVGDMIRSADVIKLNPEGDKLTEVARDYYTGWSTVVKFVDEKHLFMADDHGNLSQLVLTTDPNFVSERLILEHSSGFHVGSIMNAIMEGNLSESGVGERLFSKSFIFGTACGTLGSIGVIKEPAVYDLLAGLQRNILHVAKSAGHVNHTEWRSFYNEKRALPNHENFIDGDVIQRFRYLTEDLKKVVVLGGSHHCSKLPGDRTVRDISELVDTFSSH